MKGRDILERYQPPLDVEADMLFAAASAPVEPLAERFPSMPLVTAFGRVPLIVWFSHVRSLGYGPPDARRRLDESAGFGYHELNVVAPLKTKAIFIPGIYATSDLSLRLGWRYGMPKAPVAMSFRAGAKRVTAEAKFASVRSEVSAALLASGRILGRPFDLAAPWWTWPAQFPSGSSIRAQVKRVPRAQLAGVEGVLRLDEPWLPRPARLWPVGLFVPGFVMRLPAPVDRVES